MRILNIFRELLYETDRLTLTFDIKDRKELSKKLEALGEIDPDADYDIEIKKRRKRRSLDANAYMWVLADRISQAINSTAAEVYRKAVHEVGTFHYGAFREKDVPIAVRMWTQNGVGWIAEVEPCSIPGCKNVKFYHGSSSYDSRQMSRLIDYLVEEAKELDIETMTPDELARMKSMWGKAA
ncbi:MAG: hypothetical protein IJL97_03870 [Lachnospiraceae bacterium]|nr:hypothetical protein [Clostridia bacterium]MBR0085669.1 hypothetical protein [Lachnospiraceae bacterium]